jgi:hypothetical protein
MYIFRYNFRKKQIYLRYKFNEFLLQIRAEMQVGPHVNCQYHFIQLKFGI